VAWELKGRPLTAIEPTGILPPQRGLGVAGGVANVSTGGLCLLTNDRAAVAGAVRCEIFLPHIPVGIPTLLQVRWLEEDDDSQMFRLGLQFLI
jgi:hypothetical protein